MPFLNTWTNYLKQKPSWGLLLIGISTFLVWYPAMTGDFVWDDYTFFRGPPEPHQISLNDYREAWRMPYFGNQQFITGATLQGGAYRPVANTAYLLGKSVGGKNPVFWHTLALGLHFMNAGLFYGLLLRLFPNGLWVSLLAALLFTCHPGHHQVVAYCTGIVDSLAAVFFFVALHASLSWFHQKKFLTLLGGCALLCSVLAVLTKETAFSLIPIILLILFNSLSRTPFRVGIKALSVGGVACLYFILRKNLGLQLGWDNLSWSLDYFLTCTKLLAVNLMALTFPYTPRFMEYFYPLGFSLDVRSGWVLGACFVLTGAMVYQGRRKKIWMFGLGWMFFAYLPVANLVPLHAGRMHEALYFSDHLLYLSQAGFALGLSAACVELRTRYFKKTWFLGGCLPILLLASWGVQSHLNARTWANADLLYERVIQDNPRNWNAWQNWGIHFLLQGEPQKAANLYEILIEELNKDPLIANGTRAQAWTNLGQSYIQLGKWSDAEHAFGLAVQLFSENFTAHFGLYQVYQYQGYFEMAKQSLQTVLDLNPAHLEAQEVMQSLP